MITKTLRKKSFNNPSKGYFPEYYSEDSISSKQKNRLVDYICSLHNDDEDLKEQKIAQLDEMSYAEASDLLFEISKWQ